MFVKRQDFEIDVESFRGETERVLTFLEKEILLTLLREKVQGVL